MKNRISKIFVILGLIIATTIGCYAFSFRNMTLDFVQISDTHITERQSTPYKALGSSKELLRDAIEQINNIVGLDFVLFTGDMVDSATDENFYNFYKLLSRLKYPSLNTFGNHEFYGDMTKEQVLEVVKMVWASVEPTRGREYQEAQRIRPELTYKITTRYHKEVTPDMFIKFKDRYFQIISIINVRERNEMLEIICTEKIAEEPAAENITLNANDK